MRTFTAGLNTGGGNSFNDTEQVQLAPSPVDIGVLSSGGGRSQQSVSPLLASSPQQRPSTPQQNTFNNAAVAVTGGFAGGETNDDIQTFLDSLENPATIGDAPAVVPINTRPDIDFQDIATQTITSPSVIGDLYDVLSGTGGSAGADIGSTLLSELGLDSLLGTVPVGDFLPYLGSILSVAQGNVAGGVGSAVGQAIGSMVPIPGVNIVLAYLLGNVLTGVFADKDYPWGRISIDGNADTDLFSVGRTDVLDGATPDSFSDLGTGIADALNQIVPLLGGDITGGLSVAAGYNHGHPGQIGSGFFAGQGGWVDNRGATYTNLSGEQVAQTAVLQALQQGIATDSLNFSDSVEMVLSRARPGDVDGFSNALDLAVRANLYDTAVAYARDNLTDQLKVNDINQYNSLSQFLEGGAVSSFASALDTLTNERANFDVTEARRQFVSDNFGNFGLSYLDPGSVVQSFHDGTPVPHGTAADVNQALESIGLNPISGRGSTAYLADVVGGAGVGGRNGPIYYHNGEVIFSGYGDNGYIRGPDRSSKGNHASTATKLQKLLFDHGVGLTGLPDGTTPTSPNNALPYYQNSNGELVLNFDYGAPTQQTQQAATRVPTPEEIAAYELEFLEPLREQFAQNQLDRAERRTERQSNFPRVF